MNQYYPFLANGWIFIPVLVWSLFWKGCALWTAVKREQKIWFWVLLVINTVGILEIIYIFYVSKKKWSDIKEVVNF